MAEERRLNKDHLAQAMVQLGVGRSVLYDLVRRFRQRGRGDNTRFLDKSREDLLTACIKDFYLVPERPSLAALFQELRRRFAENQLPAPNYRTVVRRLNELDPRYAMAKRHGSKAARDKFGPVGVSSLHPGAPMDIVQIDHTRVDVMIVDREHRLSIGRPWLTLAVDIATRTVLGFSILAFPWRTLPHCRFRSCCLTRFYPKPRGSPTANCRTSIGPCPGYPA